MFARFLPRAASRLASCVAFRSQAGPRLGISPCGWPLQAPQWAPLGLQPWQQPLRAPQTRLISNKIRIRFTMSKHRRLGLDIDSNGAKSVSFMLTILERS